MIVLLQKKQEQLTNRWLREESTCNNLSLCLSIILQKKENHFPYKKSGTREFIRVGIDV